VIRNPAIHKAGQNQLLPCSGLCYRARAVQYNELMKPYFLLALILCTGLASGQTPGDITSDPHYTQLLQNDQVRVFELSLRPTEQSFVQHDHTFMMIMLQDCEVVIWRDGESAIQNFLFKKGDVRFYLGGRAYGIRNDRTTSYRNITVEFLDPKVSNWGYQWPTGTWGYITFGTGAPVDPHAQFSNSIRLGDVTVSDVQLLQADSFPAPDKPAAELLLAVTDVDLKTDGAKTDKGRLRKSSGEVVWFPAGQGPRLANKSTDPTRFVVIQFPVATP
jgi:hypothetical protein